MGSRTVYTCSKCGRDWAEDDIFFYLMEDDKLEESGWGMLTYTIERRSIAQGYICKTYCKNCDEDIKLYLLTEVKTHYPHIDPIRILEEYKHNPNKIFGNCDELKEGNKVKCKKCDNEMVLEKSYSDDDEFNLHCNIYVSSCDKCDENYTFYAIKEPHKHYTQKEALAKIEKAIGKYSLTGLFEDYESLTEIPCPSCNKTIPKENSFDKCPKCGGDFDENTICIMYD